jgi:zinc/manganese transport system substrate-binding protein
VLAALAVPALAACSATVAPSANAGGSGAILAVGAENTYANVISQIGGKYVSVTAIENNPNIDPHSFEASPSVAQEIAGARLVVQNGLGYDTYMDKIESAAPNPARKVIDVQHLLGLPDSTPNPHLWYSPATMPAVAKALASDLSALQPGHAAYFRANERSFIKSLDPWRRAIASFKAAFPGTPVAVTEPVADYLLQALGTNNLTPFGFQADVMNGVDPAPQSVTLQGKLFADHKVKAFLYNQQVTDSLTQSSLDQARRNGIPVVGVYETMPVPGYDYQSWMLTEVQALRRAVADKTSTQKL